jgi:Fur family ferric uptake transcriptional regulator
VLGVLASSGGQPVGVPQVLERLPSDTDEVTVYRTLNTFTRKRLVHRVRGEDRTWRYALGAAAQAGGGHGKPPAAGATPHTHPHFVCDGCGAVECLEKSQIPGDLVRSLRVGARYDVRYPEVLLHGLCPRCNG